MKSGLVRAVLINFIIFASIINWNSDITGILSLMLLPFGLMLLNERIK